MKRSIVIFRSLKYPLFALFALTLVSPPLAARAADLGPGSMKSLQRAIAETLAPQARLAASDETSGELGVAVSLDGKRALVGAPYDLDGEGSAYVFVYDGTQWTQEAKLTGSDTMTDALFGSAVSLSGDTALVGASYDYAGTTQPGEAFVFVRTGTTWSQTAVLKASDGATSDFFGQSVSLRGKRALIGAPGHSPSGAAYFFIDTGAGWSQEAMVTPTIGEGFGVSVSLRDNEALIGSYAENDPNEAAYFYSFSGHTWSLQATVTPPSGQAGDGFGLAVSLDGKKALIGAPYLNSVGAGYVYTFDGTSWTEQAELLPPGQPENSAVGCSVSLAGDRALLGARRGGDNLSGAAFLFTGSGSTWSQTETLLPPNGGQTAEGFGFSVSLGADHLLIGAPFEFGPEGDYNGAAYIFGAQ